MLYLKFIMLAFIKMSSPYSLCVWRWSSNLLHGSRCWCRWADWCI